MQSFFANPLVLACLGIWGMAGVVGLIIWIRQYGGLPADLKQASIGEPVALDIFTRAGVLFTWCLWCPVMIAMGPFGACLAARDSPGLQTVFNFLTVLGCAAPYLVMYIIFRKQIDAAEIQDTIESC